MNLTEVATSGPVLLAVLMSLLPVVLRLFARFEGMTTRTAVELSLMHRYFIFQIIVRSPFPSWAIGCEC